MAANGRSSGCVEHCFPLDLGNSLESDGGTAQQQKWLQPNSHHRSGAGLCKNSRRGGQHLVTSGKIRQLSTSAYSIASFLAVSKRLFVPVISSATPFSPNFTTEEQPLLSCALAYEHSWSRSRSTCVCVCV
eukprot:scpid109047/ scgid8253/ 